jgi:hypothetical protein
MEVQLIIGLDRGKAHVLPPHCLSDRPCIDEVVLVRLHKRLHKLPRDQPDKHAIEKFIAWYCSEPRLGFNRSVMVRYRSFLEGLSLSAATINLHLSAIRRLADEAAENGRLSPELAMFGPTIQE